MRRPVKNRNMPDPDEKFGSVKIAKLINYVMIRGQKDTARKIVYGAFDILAKEGDPVIIFDEALANVEPQVEVRSRRVGGANYQVPREVNPGRKMSLAYRWIIQAAQSKKGKPMMEKLANELLAARKGEGEAVAKRDNTHKMAEANKAFAHFAW
jgi:small subunit ribosomal protein S7